MKKDIRVLIHHDAFFRQRPLETENERKALLHLVNAIPVGLVCTANERNGVGGVHDDERLT